MPFENYGLKSKLTAHAGEFMAALLLVQPLLDVLSYFMGESGGTAATTALRTVLLAAVSLYGFAVSDRKQLYAAGWALMAGFWLLHMLNCFRTGYAHPIEDAAEYLKLIQFPLWTMSFVTFFRKWESLDLQVLGVLTVNFALILLVIGLSYAVGAPVYTYDYPERGVKIGVMGWFAVHSAQAAIVSLLVPPVLLWGFRTKKLWVFSLCVFAGLGLLFFTGTRLTYYTAVLAAAAFLVMVLLFERRPVFCLPLLAALIVLVALKGVSPMEQRQKVSAQSFAAYQEKIDRVMGEDKEFSYKKGEEIPPRVLGKIKSVYTEIYGAQGIYGEVLLGDLIDRFGLEQILEEFEYSIRPEVLNNARTRKWKAMEMVWEEEDALTHLLGFEYSKMRIGSSAYDLENDFPALLYYTGYLGSILYGAFVLGVILYAIRAFLRHFPALLTLEFGTAAMMFVLVLGAALLSGNVLRRPNVTVYFSLSAAMLITQARESQPPDRLRPGYKPNSAILVKKIG